MTDRAAPWPPQKGDRVNVPSAGAGGEVVDITEAEGGPRFIVELDFIARTRAPGEPVEFEESETRGTYSLDELEPA